MTYDPYELIVCPVCRGRRQTVHDRGKHQVMRRCRYCRGKGEVLRGNPLDSPYLITFDFCTGMYDCCTNKPARGANG